ncbi:hypothetical protein [Cellulomonas hominis]
MTEQQLRTLEIVSLVVVVIDFVVWYSTPDDVIVGPLLIIGVGAVGAGIAYLVRRRQSEQSTNELADRVRAERERDENRPGV